MNIAQVRSTLKDDVLPATFSAQGPGRRGDGPRVLVYAYRAGPVGGAYLWVFMEGDIFACGFDNCVLDGGREESYRAAVDKSIERLMERVDR